MITELRDFEFGASIQLNEQDKRDMSKVTVNECDGDILISVDSEKDDDTFLSAKLTIEEARLLANTILNYVEEAESF